MRRSTTLLAWGALGSPAAAWLEKPWQRAAEGWQPAASTGVPHPDAEQKYIEMGYSPRPTEAPEMYGRMLFERADSNTLGADTCGYNPNGNSFTCITGGATCSYSNDYVGCCDPQSTCNVVKTTCIDYDASSAGACDLPEDFHTLCCGTASLGACFTWTYSTSGGVYSLLDCSATSGVSELLSYDPALGSPTATDASATDNSASSTATDAATDATTDTATATATDGSSSSSSGNSSGGSSSKKKTPIGAIVGGVVGGVAAIAIIGALVFFFLRKRGKKDSPPPPQQPPVAQIQTNAPPPQSQSPGAQQPVSPPPQSPQSYVPTTPSTHYPSGVPANYPQGYNQQGSPQPYDPRVSGYSQQGSPQPYPPQPGYGGGFVPQQQQQQQQQQPQQEQYQGNYAPQKGYEQQGQFNQYGAVPGYQAPNASPPPNTTPSPAPQGNEAIGGYQQQQPPPQQHSPPPQQNYQQTYQHHSNPSDAQELPAINPVGYESNRAELG